MHARVAYRKTIFNSIEYKRRFQPVGLPIGPPAFCETAMLKRVGKVETLSKLPDIEDAQMETALLRSCLALPKVAFSLRTCPPCHVKQATASFDNIIREALAIWREAHFPNGPG